MAKFLSRRSARRCVSLDMRCEQRWRIIDRIWRVQRRACRDAERLTRTQTVVSSNWGTIKPDFGSGEFARGRDGSGTCKCALLMRAPPPMAQRLIVAGRTSGPEGEQPLTGN